MRLEKADAPTHDHFGFVFLRQFFRLFIVNILSFRVQAIADGVENFTAQVDLCAVCQMAAVRRWTYLK